MNVLPAIFICKVLVDTLNVNQYLTLMIGTFKHRGLEELLGTGKSRHVRQDQIKRIVRLLDALIVARRPDDMNVPSFGFHRLHGHPQRYAVSVNGPWRITFGWEGEDAVGVDLEQYH